MITIILEDKNSNIIRKISELSNSSYLLQYSKDYSYLSILSPYSYDVFSSKDMPQLIADLARLGKKLHSDKRTSHIDNIIDLAMNCMKSNDLTLTFTPFDE